MFGDIALGLCSEAEKPKINEDIKQLEEDIGDLDIMIKELELREGRLKKTGSYQTEVEEN